MREQMATLKEIAEKAGVSVMTVSNVVNGNYSKVSQKTAERVKKIIDELNYEPNLFARSLSAKRSHIIAIILPAWRKTRENLLSDPYNQEMVGLLEANLNKSDYYMMMRSFNKYTEVLSFFKNWNIDGAIMFYPSFRDEEMRAILDGGVPTVVIDRKFEKFPSLTVDLDDYKSGYIAAKCFLRYGHRELAFVGPFFPPATKTDYLNGAAISSRTSSTVIMDRMNGFIDGLKEYGVHLREENIIAGDTTFEAGIETGKMLAMIQENRPTGIFATMDIQAIGIIEGLKRHGLSVPGDISVIGCDDWIGCQFCDPKLTTVAQDFKEKASKVVDLLLKAIDNPVLKGERITLGVELVERNSVRRI